MGLVHMWHFFAYQGKMKVAKDVSEGDGTRCAGGITSVIYDKETGEAVCFCASCLFLLSSPSQVFRSVH